MYAGMVGHVRSNGRSLLPDKKAVSFDKYAGLF